MRLRVILGLVTLLLILATLWVVVYVNEMVVTVLPPLWVATTLGLAVTYRRLEATSPDKPFLLQLLLLLTAFTVLFLAAYVPARLEWLQVVVAGAVIVPLGALLWVRRRRRAPEA